MPNFKFIKQFSTQVSSGGFNNQISNKTIPQGTVLSGKYVDNKINGTKEVNVVISYAPIQGATNNVNVPLSYVVETTEPVSKNYFKGLFEPRVLDLLGTPIEPKPVLMIPPNNTSPQPKKYVFLKDVNLYPFSNEITTQVAKPPMQFKEGQIVDGIDEFTDFGSHNVIINTLDGKKFRVGISNPFAMMSAPILKELDSQSNSTTNKNKEKPTTTEKPTFFNKKNITTGVFVLVGVGVTLALLKWKKII